MFKFLWFSLLIPLFFVLNYFRVINTYIAVIVPYVAFTLPISILILRSFFEQIPVEIKDSAKIDGASDFRIYLTIILPLFVKEVKIIKKQVE